MKSLGAPYRIPRVIFAPKNDIKRNRQYSQSLKVALTLANHSVTNLLTNIVLRMSRYRDLIVCYASMGPRNTNIVLSKCSPQNMN